MLPCVPFQTKDGATGIMCLAKPRRRKCACCNDRWATLECDYPATSRKSGTCDRPLCSNCAIRVGPNRDHCPGHPPAAGQQTEIEGL